MRPLYTDIGPTAKQLGARIEEGGAPLSGLLPSFWDAPVPEKLVPTWVQFHGNLLVFLGGREFRTKMSWRSRFTSQYSR